MVSSDGAYAATIVVSADNKHRYVAAFGPAPGKTRIVEHLQDTAWVRALDESGPPPTTMGFVPGTARLWFLSERDGWMHLYVADLAAPDAAPRQLTSGAWEITDAQLTPDGKQFLIASTEADAGDRQVYALPVDGGTRTRLTATAGRPRDRTVTGRRDVGAAVVVGDPSARGVPGARAQDRSARSRDGRPGHDEPDAGVAGGASGSRRSIVTYKARDGATVRARLYTPEMVGAKRNRRRPGGDLRARRRLPAERAPLLVELLPRVHVPPPARIDAATWCSISTTAAAPATAATGAPAIYRHMGGKDLDDVVDGAHWLA